MASWRSVSIDYFDVLHIPLVRGRRFTGGDRLGAPGVVVINETMARQLWPGGDPLNDNLLIGRGLGPNFAAEPTRRIIGIVGDVRDGALQTDPRPTVYVPIAQLPDTIMQQTMSRLPLTWMVRTSGSTQAFRYRIEDELERVEHLSIGQGRQLSDVVRQATSDSDFYLSIMTLLAGAALMLAGIGLNGAMAYAVQQRTKEIGVRLALGAESTHVINMLVVYGMRITVGAICVGIVGALLLTRFMTTFLFGVAERDPTVFIGVSAIMLLTSWLAVWLPARVITKVDIVRALRLE